MRLDLYSQCSQPCWLTGEGVFCEKENTPSEMEAAPPLLMGFLRYTIKLLNYYGQGVDTYSNSWTGRTERCIIYLFSYYHIYF